MRKRPARRPHWGVVGAVLTAPEARRAQSAAASHATGGVVRKRDPARYPGGRAAPRDLTVLAQLNKISALANLPPSLCLGLPARGGARGVAPRDKRRARWNTGTSAARSATDPARALSWSPHAHSSPPPPPPRDSRQTLAQPLRREKSSPRPRIQPIGARGFRLVGRADGARPLSGKRTPMGTLRGGPCTPPRQCAGTHRWPTSSAW